MNANDFKLEYLNMYYIYTACCTGVSESEPYCSTYIDFARKDLLDSKDLRGICNAVSNSKRALHRRVDTLCDALGYGLDKTAKNNFPSKLGYLSKCGVITPQILYRLNSIRNKIEHDYEAIEYSEAENYIDIIELFLVATSIFLKNYPSSMSGDLMDSEAFRKYDFYKDLPKELELDVDLKQGKIVLKLYDTTMTGKIKIDISEKMYFEWLHKIMFSYFGNY